MVWSYSRLTAYEHCPFSWYRRYIEGETGEGSFYADNGKAMHEVFDALIKGEVSFEDAPSLYLEKYEAITTHVKQDIMDKTFDTCINYLCNIDDCGYRFTGFVDLLLRDDNGNLIVVDHKSSDPFLKKNGEPYAKSKEQFENYVRQLSIYCYGIEQIYGEKPVKIVFHHFKNDGKLTVLPVSDELIGDAWAWCNNIIQQIYDDDVFEAKPKTGFCYRLCDYRKDCEYTWEDDT